MAQLNIDINVNGLNQSVSGLKSLESVMKNTIGTLEQNIHQNSQYNRSLKEVSAQIKAGKGDYIELVKQQESLRNAIQSNKTAIRNQINDFNSAEGSLVEMRSQLNLATKAFDQLTKSERDNANIGGALTTKIQSLHKEITTAEQATNRFQRQVGNYSKGQANANGVALEFNRIIQDAPFGIMGVGNNIQQLASNWQNYVKQSKDVATANGTTVSSMGLVKGAFSALISPASLLTLGISAITAGWTAYSMNVKSAKEETLDMNNAFTTQIGQLTKITSLSNLNAKTERDKATAVSIYNKELGDTLGKVKNYTELENRLLKNGSSYIKYLSLKAQAEATYQISLKKTADMMNNIVNLETKGRSTGFAGWISKASDTIDEFVYGKGTQGQTKISSKEVLRIAQLPTDKEFYIAIRGMGDGLKQGLKQVRKEWKQSIETANLGADLTQQFNKIGDSLKLSMPDLNLDKDKTTKNLKEAFDYLSKIRDLVDGKQKDIDLINLDGQAKDLKELEYKWKDYFNTIGDLQNKLNRDIKNKKISSQNAGVVQGALNNASSLGSTLRTDEENEILKKYATEREDIINGMYQKVGLLETNSREKDLKKFQDYLDAQIKLLVSHGAKMEQIQPKLDEISGIGRYNINTEWDSKQLAEWGKQNDKLQAIIDKPFNARNRNSLTVEFQKRTAELKTAYETLNSLTGAKFDANEWQRLQGQLNVKLNTKQLTTDLKDYFSIANTSINTLFTSLSSNVDEFGIGLSSVLFSAGDTFKSVIGGLNSKQMDKINEQLFKGLEDGTSTMKKNWQSIKESGQATALALSQAGNLLSNIFKQNSVAGQGIGGALSGAGAGLSAGVALGGKSGGIWGAAIGAGIGLLSGIFGASKRRKQERLQQQQLAEQKKANALLERMNALAYTSQIVGGKTNYGIVSGVDRSATGEIRLKVDGRDLVAVLDKQTALSGR